MGTWEAVTGGGSVAARAVQAGKEVGSGNGFDLEAVVGGSEAGDWEDAGDCCCAWRCDL